MAENDGAGTLQRLGGKDLNDDGRVINLVIVGSSRFYDYSVIEDAIEDWVEMEAYPDLKASANMQQLSEELTSTENRVSFARQGFNDAVMSYNTYRQSFPNIVIANQFGHREDAELLEFEDSAEIQAAPNVSFS